ncbi:hypothetical protein [Stenotrophomonas maltophilia]|uniref:hypothetical protein n=1 Tax=Stenotrophomonas maltophilia TaxID=40324 RepID=UPI0021C76893|nr:hypothetical protein [Stenotrophomonas maltophilia]MCU1064779.1 hypothetical protein [Stenotrophomonas maltophilia]
MQNHWEVGVVLALRDAQWLQANPGAQIPAINISLDGNAESKMGDGVHQVGEKFALLEIKPDQSLCQSEWAGSKGPKRAYKKLMDLAAIDERNNGPDDTREKLGQSVRGHFFAYWGETQGAQSHLDQLFLQPYLLTALKALPAGATLKRPGSCYSGRPSSRHASILLKSLTVGVTNGSIFIPRWPLSLADLFSESGTARFCHKQPAATSVPFNGLLELGLEVDELQTYVNFLCTEKASDGCNKDVLEEDLKMMLIGSQGFIRHITNTAELMNVIAAYREHRLTPTPGLKPDVTRHPQLTVTPPKSRFGVNGP